jgi:serine/threonine-protein kinase HipA
VVEGAAEYFGLGLADARRIIGETGRAVAAWRDVAKNVGARPAEIKRMSSAFEHDDLAQAQRM